MKKSQEAVYFSPQVLMSVDDVVTALDGASREFVFSLIVSLEASQQDGDFLERVWAHFDAEVKKQAEGDK